VKRHALLLAPVLLIGVVAAPAQADTTVTVHVDSAIHFAPPSADCPAGSGTATITGDDGHPIGALRGCFETVTVTDTGQTFTGTLTLALQGGRITASVTGVETFVSPTLIVQELDGTVIDTTGIYDTDAGTITGGGEIHVSDGSIVPDLSFVVTLSE